MRRNVWIHQANQLAEQTPQDLANTLKPRGITGVYLKALDGTDWMSTFYSHPMAPTGPVQFGNLVAEFAAVGLELIPWVVPRKVASEARGHLQAAAAAAGKLIIDFEYHYAGFWQGSDVEVAQYLIALEQAVQRGTWVAVAPDPRQVTRDYSATLLAGLSAVQPQTYWTDFQRPALDVLSDAIGRLAILGPVEPILPYNATPNDMHQALQFCQRQGVQAVSLWRMGTANAAQLDAFAERIVGEDQPSQEDGMARVPADYVAKFHLRDDQDIGGLIGNFEGVIKTVREIALAEGEAQGADAQAKLEQIRQVLAA